MNVRAFVQMYLPWYLVSEYSVVGSLNGAARTFHGMWKCPAGGRGSSAVMTLAELEASGIIPCSACWPSEKHLLQDAATGNKRAWGIVRDAQRARGLLDDVVWACDENSVEALVRTRLALMPLLRDKETEIQKGSNIYSESYEFVRNTQKKLTEARSQTNIARWSVNYRLLCSERRKSGLASESSETILRGTHPVFCVDSPPLGRMQREKEAVYLNVLVGVRSQKVGGFSGSLFSGAGTLFYLVNQQLAHHWEAEASLYGWEVAYASCADLLSVQIATALSESLDLGNAVRAAAAASL